MTRLYVAQAQVTRVKDGWSCTSGIATFLLDGGLFGVREDGESIAHVERIVRGILNPFNDEAITVHPNVWPMDDYNQKELAGLLVEGQLVRG